MKGKSAPTTKTRRTAPPTKASRTFKKPLLAAVIGGIVLIAVIVAFVVFGFAPKGQQIPDAVTNAPNLDTEVTHADVVSAGLGSSTISVLGVRVGMTESQILALLGPADKAQEYDFGAIQNWEYSTSLGLNQTGIILHLRQGIVTRIMIYSTMNDYLIGETRVEDSREDVYATLGLPDRQYDIKGGRYFVYNERGLEVFIGPQGETALGIVFENRKLPTTATIKSDGVNITKPATPRLITDTTTLCNQGPTFAFNIGSGACTAYQNACIIPDNDVEVRGCAPEFVTDEVIREAIIASW